MFIRRGSALLRSTLQRRTAVNLPKQKVDGDFQVWVGYLRKPPAACTGLDMPMWMVPVGWAGIMLFMWIWGSGPVMRNRALRREIITDYIYPQIPLSMCETEQERREMIQAFCDANYKDAEEDDDDE